MALVKCYECSKQISDNAKSCPHCGATKVSEKETLKKDVVDQKKKVKFKKAESNNVNFSITSVIKNISKFRENKLNYINRYIAFILLYSFIDFAAELDNTSLTVISAALKSVFGGVVLAPMMFLLLYFCASIFNLWFKYILWWSNYQAKITMFSDFKNWIKEFHNYNISLALILADICLVMFILCYFMFGLLYLFY